LTRPTLLVRGGVSDDLSETGAQEFLALCPMAGERNDIFAAAVIEFLARAVQTPQRAEFVAEAPVPPIGKVD